MKKYEEQNGFLPIQLELGNTTSNNTDYNTYIMESMYPLLHDIGVEAVLIQDYEIKDSDNNFLRRLEMPVPNVLSNVYPKKPDTKFADLMQFYRVKQSNGVNVYFVNIYDTEKIKQKPLIVDNYDIIEPVEFLDKFIGQINPWDVLVARLCIWDKNIITDLLASDAGQRVDFTILPPDISKDFITEDEKNLVKLNSGWNSAAIAEEENKQEELKRRLEEKRALDGQANPSEVPVGPFSLTNGDSSTDSPQPEIINPNQDTDNQRAEIKNGSVNDNPSANQGGSLEEIPVSPETDEKIKSGDIPNLRDATSESSGDTKTATEGNKPSKTEMDLSVKTREFMDILNEYRIIPEPSSAEYMREIYFKRTPDGQFTISVSDITIDENLPEVEEIKTLADEITAKVDVMKQKESIKRQVGYIERKAYDTGENPYTGSQACQECHLNEFNIWSESKHAIALQSLIAKGKQENESCLSCHKTRWVQPANYNKEWTFDSFAPELGCESCHGPGRAHINLIEFAIQGDRAKLWDYIKSEQPNLYLKDMLADAKTTCMQCHDKSNSPDFDFVKYWEMIEHTMSFSDDPLQDVLTIRNLQNPPAENTFSQGPDIQQSVVRQ